MRVQHGERCAGVVLGPGRHLTHGETVEAKLLPGPGGHRYGVVAFEMAQAIVAVEVLGIEVAEGQRSADGAAIARALREPTRPGEYMVVVVLAEGTAVVPVMPVVGRGRGSA